MTNGNGVKVTQRKISDYVPDPHNANKGTERGQYMIDASVGEFGLARSIVAAADNTIPAGNKTLQAAIDAGFEDVIEVETDGRALVVVKRIDWPTVDDERARKYAYYDNRSGQVDLEWDVEQIVNDLDSGVDLSDLFFDHELEEIAQLAEIESGELPEIGERRALGDRARVVKVALYVPDLAVIEAAIQATGLANRGEAMVQICRAFLDEKGQFDLSV